MCGWFGLDKRTKANMTISKKTEKRQEKGKIQYKKVVYVYAT